MVKMASDLSMQHPLRLLVRSIFSGVISSPTTGGFDDSPLSSRASPCLQFLFEGIFQEQNVLLQVQNMLLTESQSLPLSSTLVFSPCSYFCSSSRTQNLSDLSPSMLGCLSNFEMVNFETIFLSRVCPFFL